MLFKKKKPTAPKPDAVFTYPQTKNYRGFKRIKLSSYGYQPALDGIAALSGTDLTGATITITVFTDDNPRAVVSEGQYEVGAIWKHSFNQWTARKVHHYFLSEEVKHRYMLTADLSLAPPAVMGGMSVSPQMCMLKP